MCVVAYGSHRGAQYVCMIIVNVSDFSSQNTGSLLASAVECRSRPDIKIHQKEIVIKTEMHLHLACSGCEHSFQQSIKVSTESKFTSGRPDPILDGEAGVIDV